MSSRLVVIIVLGTTQTLAWASSYYLPAILADRIAGEIGFPSTWFFAAFSSSLVISALIGPRVGRTIDAIGGREVLIASNIVMAAGLIVLAAAHSLQVLWIAWLILGVGMGLGLYDTAFATLGRIASLLKRLHPLISARLAVTLHPIGAGVLALAGAGAGAGVFAVLHGAGSGILTIARGTVPLAIFGAENYGYRLGLLGAPSRITTAAAPLLFGVLIERFGAGALIFSSALSAAALWGLCSLPQHRV